MDRLRFCPLLEGLEDRDVPAWTSVASLPAALAGASAAVTLPNGKILAIADQPDSSGALAAAEYDVASNSWTQVQSMATGQAAGWNLALGSDGRAYALGALQISGAAPSTPTGVVMAYNPNTQTWTNLFNNIAEVPTPRILMGTTTGTDGRIYALGGTPSIFQFGSATAQVYSASTNTWSNIADLPQATVQLASATGPDGLIYAVGGNTGAGIGSSNLFAYNPSTNSWTVRAPMPTPRSDLAAVTGSDGLIYAIGGLSETTPPLSTVETYDPATNTWSTGESVPFARFGLAAVRGPDGRIYAIGGLSQQNPVGPPFPVTTVEVFTPDVRLTPNQQFVVGLYADILHRSPDQAGLNYWTGLLDNHQATTSQVALAIEQSDENDTNTVQNFYLRFLGRAADAGGLIHWVNALNGGATPQQVAAFIQGSDEFFARFGANNNQFLQAVYQLNLGRAPDSAGAAVWGNFLAQGGSRTNMAYGVLASQEASINQVQNYYLAYLNRAADAQGLAAWVDLLLHGVGSNVVAAGILGSPEFYALQQV